jgi:hypothetical protein
MILQANMIIISIYRVLNIFAIIVLMMCFLVNASMAQQESIFPRFINHTEMGTLLGKVRDLDKRVNFSIQSFNGVRVNRFHAVGFLVGLDTYPGFNLMPFALGWRGILDKDKKLAPYASLDLGYSSSWMQHKTVDANMEYWKQGGSYFSPSLGILVNPSKSAMVYSLSIGYKRQNAFYYEGFRDPQSQSRIPSEDLPTGCASILKEAYVFNSLYLKMGIIF